MKRATFSLWTCTLGIAAVAACGSEGSTSSPAGSSAGGGGASGAVASGSAGTSGMAGAGKAGAAGAAQGGAGGGKAGAGGGKAGAGGTTAGAGAGGAAGAGKGGGAGGGGAGAAGASGAGAGGAPIVCLGGLTSLTLTAKPASATLDGASSPPITVSATGTFSGSMKDVPGNALSWSVSRGDATPPGTIVDGVLTPYPSAGGVVTVTATDGCVTASTTVHLSLEAKVGSPTNPADWSGTPVTTGPAPTIVYPSDKTRFPRNIYRTLFQWRTAGLKEFRLTFKGPNGTVVIYTDGAHPLCANKTPAAACWEADEATWEYIAASNAGGLATWTVEGIDGATPPVVHASSSIELGFSKQDVKGAIFYWSTTSAGIRRGRLSSPNPEDYIVGKPPTTYTNPADQVKCVACHTVSRDGKYMAAPVSASSGAGLWVMEVTPAPPPKPLVKNIPNTTGHGFATISPNDERVVAAWKGVMWELERATGTYVKPLPLGAVKGTHPDWSPDGTQVVFATGDGDSPAAASLDLIPYNAGAWGPPTTLLKSASKNESNLFPSFSPDGTWVGFSRGKGGHGDPTAQLMVIRASGGAPVACSNANLIVSNQTTTGQFQNSQPTWAPPGDFNWVAFNSKREYGVVLPAGTQQIWVAAMDLSKAELGDDPSFPAFRLQFQGLQENNHRAFWTLDITQGTGGAGGAAGMGGAAGAGGQGGVAGAGGAPACKTDGQDCDPTNDCCTNGQYCDTPDDGATYVCMGKP